MQKILFVSVLFSLIIIPAHNVFTSENTSKLRDAFLKTKVLIYPSEKPAVYRTVAYELKRTLLPNADILVSDNFKGKRVFRIFLADEEFI